MVTLKAVKWEPHLAVKGRVEIFESCEKILPDLDSGVCGIIVSQSVRTFLFARAFVHLIRASGCSAS